MIRHGHRVFVALLAALGVGRAAAGAELHPVRAGESVEAVAAALGDPGLADEIRALNGLAADAQPHLGQILTLPPPATGDGVEQQAFLLAVEGDVRATGRNGDPIPPTPFRSIPMGATVCTGANGHAALRMSASCNGSGPSDDVTLSTATCVRIDSVYASSLGRSTLLRVVSGEVAVAPSDVIPASVAIVTDSGAAIGSGGFRVRVGRAARAGSTPAGGDGTALTEAPPTMTTEALTSTIAVQGRATEIELLPRTGTRVVAGGDPDAPTPLLAPTELGQPPPGERLGRPRFTWEEVAGAFAYRLEIATNEAFTAVVYTETAAEPAHAPPSLLLPAAGPAPRLWWRVAAVDRLGFVGVPSEPRPFGVPGG